MKKFKSLNAEQMSAVKGGENLRAGETLISAGYDAGGHYVIVDTGTSCLKRYQTCVFDEY